MKIPTKISLPIIVLMLGINSVNAQDAKVKAHNSEIVMDQDTEMQRFEKISHELNLDDTQKEKIQRLLSERKREMAQFREKRKEKMEELRNDEASEDDKKEQKEDLIEARKELHREFRAELKNILNEEQYARFMELEKQTKVDRSKKRKMHDSRRKPSKAQPNNVTPGN